MEIILDSVKIEIISDTIIIKQGEKHICLGVANFFDIIEQYVKNEKAVSIEYPPINK